MKKIYEPTPPATFHSVDSTKCYGVQINSLRGIIVYKRSHECCLIVDVKDLKCLNETYQAESLSALVDKVHNFGHKVFQFDTAKEMYLWALETL